MKTLLAPILAVLLLLLACKPGLAGPTVLLIWDTQGPQTESLKKSLEDSSIKVVLSQTEQSRYDGTNPPLTGIDVVVHLNGTTYDYEMPLSGQQALVHFVLDGGGYIHHEWNAYQLSMGKLAALRDLILFDRESGYSGPMTITRVKEQANHPVVWEIPPSFQMTGGANIGHIHAFEKDPAVVLARDDRGNDAIAVREHGLGRIVGFHHGGNWNIGSPDSKVLESRDARRLFVDAVLWAHGCGDFYRKGKRQEVCDLIAAKRKVLAQAPLQIAQGGDPVVVEAEHPTGRDKGSEMADHAWTEVSNASASGGKAMEATPNTGAGVMDRTTGPRLDYAVRLPKGGTWFIWLRLLGPSGQDDSVHAGLDGKAATFGGIGMCHSNYGQWAWVNTVWDRAGRVTVEVPQAGQHTFNLWMREDGVLVDKIVLTSDPNFTPTGLGPPETPAR